MNPLKKLFYYITLALPHLSFAAGFLLLLCGLGQLHPALPDLFTGLFFFTLGVCGLHTIYKTTRITEN